MKHLKLLAAFLVVLIFKPNFTRANENVVENISEEENEASKLVDEINHQRTVEANKLSEANWKHDSQITKENAENKRNAQEKYASFTKTNALHLMKFKPETFKNESLKRMIKKLTNIGDSILDTEDFLELEDAIMRMKTRYAKAKVQGISNRLNLLSLEPELTVILSKSRNADELKYYWANWYDLTGEPSREDFFKYVELRNKAARINSK